MLELIAGVVVAIVAIALVLQPLYTGVTAASAESVSAADVEFTDLEESESPKVQALLALKEIEFDRETGKLSDDDFAVLKAKYSRVALEAIKAEDGAGAAGVRAAEAADAEAESLIRRVAEGQQAACPNCGPRPEVGAAFCSTCGAPLGRASSPAAGPSCSSCGAALDDGAKFCSECGAKVVATVGT